MEFRRPNVISFPDVFARFTLERHLVKSIFEACQMSFSFPEPAIFWPAPRFRALGGSGLVSMRRRSEANEFAF